MPVFKLHRIKEIAAKRDISIRKVGKMAGLSNSAISEMVKRNAANIINVQKIATVLNVDVSEFVELENGLVASDRDRENLSTTIQMMREIQNNIRSSGLIQLSPQEGYLPIISFELMETNSLNEVLQSEDRHKKYLIPNAKDADFLVTMPGYAMQGDFNPGDTLICKHEINKRDLLLEYGKAYIMETEQGFIIRRVMPSEQPDSIYLISPNPNFPAFNLSRSAVQSFNKILGKIRLE